MEIVDVMKCFVLKFSVKLEKATSITAILVSQDHLSSLCNTDVRANEISITVHAPLKPEVCIFFTLFFTVVYILELLVLQEIYVLLSWLY